MQPVLDLITEFGVFIVRELRCEEKIDRLFFQNLPSRSVVNASVEQCLEDLDERTLRDVQASTSTACARVDR